MSQIRAHNEATDSKKDLIFSGKDTIKKFSFNRVVSKVFDDMASRSIPLYHKGQENITDWTKLFYKKKTNLYDVGCSTGTTIVNLMKTLDQDYHIIGIDSSKDMIEQAKKKSNLVKKRGILELKNITLEEAKIENASVIILNYVLQFISTEKRLDLLKKIYAGLNPGGALIISEKLSSSNKIIATNQEEIYMKFKKLHGYSQEEINRKKKALKGILTPISFQDMVQLFQQVGFQEWTPILCWNQFFSWIVTKDDKDGR